MIMDVGTPVLLEFGSNRERVKSVFVGAVKKQHALFSVALTTGIKGKAREGNRVTARYMNNGTVYGFQTEVADFRPHPSAIVFLHYPVAIEEMEIRSAKRVDCYFPCELLSKSKNVEGLIVDISEGGCRLTFESDPKLYVPKIDVGSRLKTDFFILEEKNRYTLHATLQHRKMVDGKLFLGLRFEKKDDDFRGVVADYVEKVCRMLE